MLDDVLKDVRADYKLVSSSYSAEGAVGAIKGFVMKYMMSGSMSYAEGIRMVCCLLLILVEHKKGKENGTER